MTMERWTEQVRFVGGRPFKVWYDTEHGCARFWARGAFTGADATHMNAVEKQLMDDLGKVHWVIEIGECKLDAAARRVFAEAGKDPRNDKLAFVGLPAVVRWILTLSAKLRGNPRERHFAAGDVDKAFAWLLR